MRDASMRLRAVLVVGFILVASTATAQEKYQYSVSLLGGLGGSLDDSDVGFGGGSFQAGFSFSTFPLNHVAVRAGTFDLDDDPLAGPLRDGEVRYANVAGEYRFHEGYYQSGVYFGLGVYDLSARVPADDETELGLVLGVTGDFEIQPRWAIYVELAAHYADFEKSDLFGTGHVGLAFNF